MKWPQSIETNILRENTDENIEQLLKVNFCYLLSNWTVLLTTIAVQPQRHALEIHPTQQKFMFSFMCGTIT
jgi:hypothetical protein